jgi:hypothetical protein
MRTLEPTMPAIDLKDANLQLAWAKRHLHELEGCVSSFVASKPYEIFTEEKAGTDRVAVKVRAGKAIPDSARMLTGDVIHSLRVPLDYLACELATLALNDKKGVSFPFGRDLASFNKEVGNKLGKLDASGRAFIAALEPYAGGKGQALWALHQLDIGHKHLDVVLLGMQSATRSIGFSHVSGGTVHIDQLVDGYQSLKEPLELMTVTKGASVNSRVEIITTIGFGEGEVAAGFEVLPTLNQLAGAVEQILADAQATFS